MPIAVIAIAVMAVSAIATAAMALATLCRRMAADDPFDKALRDLERALDANARRMAQIKRRIAEIRRQRSAGRSYREIVEAAKGDLSVQLITEATQSLDEFGARVRRTEALALYGEGMTMEEIAEKFGVTRQRVSALLRDAGGEVSGGGGRAEPPTSKRAAARRG
jgi:predicted transcriptional regulator